MFFHKGFINGLVQGKLTDCENDLAALFDHLEEGFSYKEVQFEMFCLSLKTNFSHTKYIYETLLLEIILTS